MKKVRVVIELEREEYDAFELAKAVSGLKWRDFLMGGLVFWNEKLDLTKRFEELREQVMKTLEVKQN